MKVLYVAHFREGSGFSIASENYVRALASAGVDIVCRNIKLSSSNHSSPPIIAELEKKSLDGVTHIIQHVLPHHMAYVGGIKNIGLFVYDLSDPNYSGWSQHLSCMDEVWVPNPECANILPPYLFPKVRAVPHAFDTSVYTKAASELNVPEIGGSCVFYTIADLTKRKNLRDTIFAFHSEFHSNEPVSLVIKTSKFGLTPEECAESVRRDLNTIKSELKLYPSVNDYKPEILITHSLTEDQLLSIHKSGYCYVNTSRGDAFNMPQFDAWAHGNHVVFYTDGNMYNYFKYAARDSRDLLHPVICKKEPCFGYTDTFAEIGTAREEWLGSNIKGLMVSMRQMYYVWKSKINTNKLVHDDYELFSYEEIGNLMKGYLV